MRDCKAIRQGDQMQCPRCGLAWDVDDTDRPQCASASLSARLRMERNRKQVARLRRECNLPKRVK